MTKSQDVLDATSYEHVIVVYQVVNNAKMHMVCQVVNNTNALDFGTIITYLFVITPGITAHVSAIHPG